MLHWTEEGVRLRPKRFERPRPMITGNLHLAILALCCSFTGSQVKGETLAQELKRRAPDEGLALVRINGEPVYVLQPIGGLSTEPNPRSLSSAWLSSGGAAAAWSIQYLNGASPWFCSSPLIVDGPNGTERFRLPGEVINVVAGVSPDGKSVAFFGTYKPPHSGTFVTADNERKWITGLQYASDTGVHLVFRDSGSLQHPKYPVGSISWSPDGRAFVYDYHGGVSIYDLQNKTSRVIASGSNPDWSPDGHWIAFRSPEGLAYAIDPVSLQLQDLFGHRKILWGVHWSPDSHYVMLSEQFDLLSNLLHFRNPFVMGVMTVLRIEDGASVPVESVFDPGISDRNFYWVTGYRNFLGGAAHRPKVEGCE